eukprot:m.414938 g.414938  ORF g.414938 m.414938 type:complete len:227 (-) comp20176_c5_seq4:738-1418(-)
MFFLSIYFLGFGVLARRTVFGRGVTEFTRLRCAASFLRSCVACHVGSLPSCVLGCSLFCGPSDRLRKYFAAVVGSATLKYLANLKANTYVSCPVAGRSENTAQQLGTVLYETLMRGRCVWRHQARAFVALFCIVLCCHTPPSRFFDAKVEVVSNIDPLPRGGRYFARAVRAFCDGPFDGPSTTTIKVLAEGIFSSKQGDRRFLATTTVTKNQASSLLCTSLAVVYF